jgi:hypothetical protein
MQRPPAGAATLKLSCGGELLVNAGEKAKKCEILQNGVAHLSSLLAS